MKPRPSWVCVGAGATFFLDGLIHTGPSVFAVGEAVSVSPLGADIFPMNGWAARSEKGISESEPVSARALAEQNLKPEG